WLMADNQQKIDIQRNAAKNETKQAHLGREDRYRELHERYNTALELQKEKFEQQIDELRERQRECTTRNREELLKTHGQEMERFRDHHHETVADLRNDLRVTRNNAQQRLRQQQIGHMSDKMRVEESHLANIRKMATDHNDIQAET